MKETINELAQGIEIEFYNFRVLYNFIVGKIRKIDVIDILEVWEWSFEHLFFNQHLAKQLLERIYGTTLEVR